MEDGGWKEVFVLPCSGSYSRAGRRPRLSPVGGNRGRYGGTESVGARLRTGRVWGSKRGPPMRRRCRYDHPGAPHHHADREARRGPVPSGERASSRTMPIC